jgi:hypothetical protein
MEFIAPFACRKYQNYAHRFSDQPVEIFAIYNNLLFHQQFTITAGGFHQFFRLIEK